MPSKFFQSSDLRETVEIIEGPRHREPKNEETEKHLMKVEEFIKEELQKSGFEVREQLVEIEEYNTRGGSTYRNLQGKNIIGTKSGKSSNTLVIACHHDTVPLSPGADDNASGIAVFLALAKLLGQKENLQYSLMFVSFDFEELGLIGSSYFVSHLAENFESSNQIIGVLMLEMVGFFSNTIDQQLPPGFGSLYRSEIKKMKIGNELKANFLAVVHNPRSKFIARAFGVTQGKNQVMRAALIQNPTDIPVIGFFLKVLLPSLSNLLRSDHTPFWESNIPAVMITDTSNFRNDNYHLPSDKSDTLNYEMMAEAADLIYLSILEILSSYS